MHMTDKELTIRQIGEFCTNTLCKKCPVAKWNEESGLHNGCMESLMSEELKPCPFCGGKAVIEVIEPHRHIICKMPVYKGGAFIECTECGCAISGETETEATEKWNRRMNDPEKVVKQLEEYRSEMEQFGCDGILTDMIEIVKGGGEADA